MENIVVYKVDLERKGRITQLPDSQKIFGTLIYQYLNRNSNEKVDALIEKIQKNYLAISNIIPEGYIPTPKEFLMEKISEKEKGSNLKEFYKEIKKRDYIPLDELFHLMGGRKRINDIPYISVEKIQQLHICIDELIYGIPGMESSLYSVPEVLVKKYSGNKLQKKEELFKFSFYIAFDNKELEKEVMCLLEMLKKEEDILCMGARGSQGLNLYQIISYKEENLYGSRHTTSYLNLGMLLPNKINYKDSYLTSFMSERRPYDGIGLGKMEERYFITFLNAGSVIEMDDGISIKEAGQIIPSKFDENSVVFGNSFLYPIYGLKAGKIDEKIKET